MSANCLTLYYSAISTSFVTNRHALLVPALQTAGQIELDGNLIGSPESIRLLNRLFRALV